MLHSSDINNNNKIDNQNIYNNMKWNSIQEATIHSQRAIIHREKEIFLLLLPSWRSLLGTINDFFSSFNIFLLILFFWFNFNFYLTNEIKEKKSFWYCQVAVAIKWNDSWKIERDVH